MDKYRGGHDHGCDGKLVRECHNASSAFLLKRVRKRPAHKNLFTGFSHERTYTVSAAFAPALLGGTENGKPGLMGAPQMAPPLRIIAYVANIPVRRVIPMHHFDRLGMMAREWR